MAMPVKNAKITNAYQDPLCTIKYSKGYHPGIDFVSVDKNIYATLDSMVLLVGWDPKGWGENIILRTTDGKYDIIHAHLSSTKVKQGEKVKAGDVIGIMGTTGNSTGVHLHYEVRKAPWVAKNDISPATFLGIKNKRGTAESVATKNIKHLILCNHGPDERAAGYLADYLSGQIDYLGEVTKETLGETEYCYVIGSKEKPIANCVNIIGTDRHDTCRKVLDIIQGRN